MFDHQLTVVVTGQCSSSCASYIFTAAKRKQIEPKAFVMFSEHQSYQDFVQTLIQLSEKRRLNGEAALSGDETKKLYFGEKWVGLKKNYFKKIGVDMGITSVGYVPGSTVSHWLLSGKRMAEFGVSNVTLTAHYASQEYCDRMKLTGFVRFDAQCL